MCRQLTLVAIAAVVALLPSSLIAGGPPWLCVPIDGVTTDNSQACVQLIEENLGSRTWSGSEHYGAIKVVQDQGQSYLTFYLKSDVGLADIQRALKGSEFSIPRDKLHLFGHVVLQVDAGKSSPKELAAALEAIDHVTMVDSQSDKQHLLVTVEMPYPVVAERPSPDWIGWQEFARNDYSSESAQSKEATTRQSLPGFDAFQTVLASHSARLDDIRWSTKYACRALGCVIATPSEDVAVATNKTP
jgi:hypothetical protein